MAFDSPDGLAGWVGQPGTCWSGSPRFGRRSSPSWWPGKWRGAPRRTAHPRSHGAPRGRSRQSGEAMVHRQRLSSITYPPWPIKSHNAFHIYGKMQVEAVGQSLSSSPRIMNDILTAQCSNNLLTEGSVGKGLWMWPSRSSSAISLRASWRVVDMSHRQARRCLDCRRAMSISIIIVLTTVIFGTVTATAAFVSRAYGQRYERIR